MISKHNYDAALSSIQPAAIMTSPEPLTSDLQRLSQCLAVIYTEPSSYKIRIVVFP